MTSIHFASRSVGRLVGTKILVGTKTLVVSAILIGSALAGAAHGQAPATYHFGQVVVTADRPRVVEEITTVDKITAEEIERSGARTLDEAIALLPGLQLRRGAEGISLLDIRGLRARNVVLLLDGVPLNSSFDGLFDPAALPLTAVARIELTRGAGSVLYGPSGNAGVVNVITRVAGDVPDGAVLLESGDPESSRVTGAASWRRGELGLLASGSYHRQDGFDLSDDFEASALEDGGRRLNSDRKDRSALFNLTSALGRDTSWGLTLGYRGSDRGKPPVTEDFRTSIFAPRTRFERVESDAFSMHAGLSKRFANGLLLRPSIFANRESSLTDGFDDATYETQAAAGAFREDATANVVGTGIQLALERPSGSLWTLGVDVRRERWRAEGFELSTVTGGGGNGGGGDGGGRNGGGGNGGGGNGGGGNGGETIAVPFDNSYSAEVASLALEHELVTDGPWSAVAGVGFAAQQRPGADDETGAHWLIGARRSMGSAFALRGSVARQIRFPTLRDLFDVDRGNPDLKTERTLHVELAAEASLGNRTRLELALFRSNAEDFIQGVPGGRLANTEEARRQGAEITLRSRVGDLRFQSAYTYLEAENRSPGADTETIQNQPKHSGNVAIDYSTPFGLDLRAEWRFVADRFALSRTRPTQERELDDYTLLALRAAWALRDNLRMVGRVSNAFDKNYEESIGFPGPGRTFTLGLELRR